MLGGEEYNDHQYYLGPLPWFMTIASCFSHSLAHCLCTSSVCVNPLRRQITPLYHCKIFLTSWALGEDPGEPTESTDGALSAMGLRQKPFAQRCRVINALQGKREGRNVIVGFDIRVTTVAVKWSIFWGVGKLEWNIIAKDWLNFLNCQTNV